jgi:hypothetical protein
MTDLKQYEEDLQNLVKKIHKNKCFQGSSRK